MNNEPANMSAVARKLQIKPGKSWLFYKAPENYPAVLEPLPAGVKAEFSPGGNFDGIQLFATDSSDLIASLKVVVPILKPDTIFWITYPKKSSGILSDLEMTGSWAPLALYNLRPVATAAVNEIWTAIRVRREGQSKVSEFRNGEIRKNEHSAFIDPENRQIILPSDLKQVLEQSPVALSFFDALSFTNKKEYVVWILSAKQEKTRNERLAKITEKLLAKKRNPSEK
ncbi:MAG: YdeI family protein [Sphingobacteriales bacterium]